MLLKYLKNYTDNCYIKNGNVIGNFGNRKNGTPHILIDAHIDQVGLIVTNIYESGFIGFSNVGGIDRRLLPAQQVCIHGKKKNLQELYVQLLRICQAVIIK